MRKHLIMMLLFILMLTIVQPAQAQTTATLENLTVEVWPEFDQPSALVFYSGTVSDDTQLPVELTFSLPPDATINAVAIRSEQGLVSIPSDQGDTSVTFTTENGTFHIEFYDPAFIIEGDQRSYQVMAPSNYPVNTLIWSLQLPPDAENWQSEPEGGIQTQGVFGLTNVEGMLENVAIDTETVLRLSYTRPTTALVQTLLQTTSQQTDTTSPNLPESTSSPLSTTTILGMVLGVILLVGILVVMARPTLIKSITGNRSAAPTRHTKEKAGRFCTQCGKGIAKNDHFCRYCGAQQT